MKKLLFAALLPLLAQASWAQETVIYRCGNEYTNNAAQAKADKNCKPVEGGSVTVLHPAGPAPSGSSAAARSPANAPKVSGSVQRVRDGDARSILQTELDSARKKLDELRETFNDGNPVRTALELRNPQYYVERVEQLKAEIARQESDVAGIERELQRLQP